MSEPIWLSAKVRLESHRYKHALLKARAKAEAHERTHPHARVFLGWEGDYSTGRLMGRVTVETVA